MNDLYKLIIGNIKNQKIDKDVAIQIIEMIKKKKFRNNNDIAIIGIGSRLPDCENLNDFWTSIKGERDFIKELPQRRKKDIEQYFNYIDYPTRDYFKASFLDSIDLFDNRFFNIPPKEAQLMDPQHRIFLEVAHQALEDSGHSRKSLKNLKTGIYVGFGTQLIYNYAKMMLDVDPKSFSIGSMGVYPPVLASRLSYFLNLTGPSLIVDTACSSSLTALHLACQGLLNNDCDIAIAGGVKLHVIPSKSFLKIGIEDEEGKARAFDDSSNGTGMGEGIAALVLKPLSKALKDKDYIYAVLKGSAINQDGYSAKGITAPNMQAQVNLIEEVWKNCDVDPESIAYIETHGTGTKLGDPIEIDALNRAFQRRTSKKQFCAINSLKSNMGHLYEAAGIVGVLKAVLALKNKKIPASIHFRNPNRMISFENSSIYVNDKLKDWDNSEHKRTCGVSSFGLSGTNCHFILEEAAKKDLVSKEDNKIYLFCLSAKNIRSLKHLLLEYDQFLEANRDIPMANICYSASTGRGHYNHRLIITCNNSSDLKSKIKILLINNLNIEENKDIYYAEHQDTNKKLENYISPSELVELSKEINQKIQNNIKRDNFEFIQNICLAYIQGADINWEDFYPEKLDKVLLPHYYFDRKRFWVEIPKINQSIDKKEIYHRLKWEESEIENLKQDREIKKILIIRNGNNKNEEIVQFIKNKEIEYIEVEIAQEYRKINERKFYIEGNFEDYQKIFKEVRPQEVDSILHIATIKDKTENKEIKNELNNGLYSLFYLSKAILEYDFSKINLFLLSDFVHNVVEDQKLLNCVQSAFFGLSKSISFENSHIKSKCIDIDERTNTTVFMNELWGNDNYVAFRNNKKFKQYLHPLKLNNTKADSFKLKNDGVYIIAGGAGELGLASSKFLAEKNQNINIIWINRSQLESKDHWDAILKNQDSKNYYKIKTIRDLEKMGVNVEYYSCDISIEESLNKSLCEIKEKYAKINGIINAAGVAGDEFLIKRSKQKFDNVVNPKILGTYNLDKLTQNEDLDFFIVYSSVATLAGALGQGDYAAANSYLDAFVSFRNITKGNTFCINLPPVIGIGMAIDFDMEEIIHPVNVDIALKALNSIVTNQLSYPVYVGEINFSSRALQYEDFFPFNLSSDLKKRVKTNTDNKSNTKEINYDINLMGKDEYTDLERTIATIFYEVLGIDEIHVKDSFFELGGDSRLLVQVQMALDMFYPGKINTAKLFSHSSVEQIAQYLSGLEQPEQSIDSLIDQFSSGEIDIEDAFNSLTDMTS